MKLIEKLQSISPMIAEENGEALLCWDGILTVVIGQDCEVKQFATRGAWRRRAVEDAVYEYLIQHAAILTRS